jgi:WD40 repeat protein
VISKDGFQAVSASWDHTARVWDLTRSVEVLQPEGHASEVEDVVARGEVGASGARNGSVIFWNLASGKGRHGDLSHGDIVTGIAVSHDGRRAISAALNGELYVWDVARGKCVRTMELPHFRQYRREVTALAISDDGRVAIAGYIDGLIVIWNLDNGGEAGRLVGHDMWVSSLTILNGFVISSSWDKTLRLWDRESQECVDVLGDHVSRVDMALVATTPSPRVIAACADGTLVIWDVQTSRRLHEISAHAGKLSGMALAGSETLATVGWDGVLRLWDLTTGQHVSEFTLDARPNVVASDTHIIAVGTDNGVITAWSAETRKPLAAWTASAPIKCLALTSADGSGPVLIAGDTSGGVHILEVVTESHVGTPQAEAATAGLDTP